LPGYSVINKRALNRIETTMMLANLALIDNNGTLAAIIPHTLINGEWALELRKYISNNYNVKYIGTNTQDNFGDYILDVVDFNNDGFGDLVIGGSMADKAGVGEIYIIYGNSGYCNNQGVSLNISDSSNYDLKYTGPSGGSLGYPMGPLGANFIDANNDGSLDILTGFVLTGVVLTAVC